MPTYSIESIWDDITRMGQMASSRLQDALRAFERLDLDQANRIIEADDVFDVLYLSIEEKCHYLTYREVGEEESRFLRAAQRVGANLEHIGDAACHIAKRVGIAHHEQLAFVPFDLGEMEPVALASIRESLDAFFQKDLKLVEEACLREPQHDAIYVEKLSLLQQRMKAEPSHINFLLLWFSVMKYLEKVSDYTLNIGEQAIFLTTGRRLKFAQYQQLDRLLPTDRLDGYKFSPYYDGISGAIVARIESRQKVLVYKEGAKRKIDAEAAKLKEWGRIFSSMAPQVISTDTKGEREILLREFVSGSILSEIYLDGDSFEKKEQATRALLQSIRDVWQLTIKQEPAKVEYTAQIKARLGEVFAMHPYLEYLSSQKNLDELLEEVAMKEPSLDPGFVVWLHGDLNINNIFFQDGHIQFIDVHRSEFGDYLRDIGVLLVSTLRMANLMKCTVLHMERIRAMILDSVQEFGEAKGDRFFQTRLDLSLARSYITSSRIIVEKKKARELFETGLDLLTRVAVL